MSACDGNWGEVGWSRVGGAGWGEQVLSLTGEGRVLRSVKTFRFTFAWENSMS